jgi:aminopeptidase N
MEQEVHRKHLLIFLIGNATTNDLWSALSKASGQDVHSFMVSVDHLLGRSNI